MKKLLMAASLLLSTASAAFGACGDNPTCTAGNILTAGGAIVYRCDYICPGSGNGNVCHPTSFAACDVCGQGGDPSVPDGNCVICDDNDSSDITGTSGNDVICGSGGNDEIDGQGNNDKIEGGSGADTLFGDGGDDQILGGSGANLIYGGAGDDFIHTSTDSDAVAYGDGDDDLIIGSVFDDSLYGGTGGDAIIGVGGADFLDGGDGDDALSPVIIWTDAVKDDVIGPTYCGGDGNDTINGQGPRHVCVDAGAGTDTCRYSFNVTPNRTQEATDIGTETGCETITSGYAFNSTREPNCGCPE